MEKTNKGQTVARVGAQRENSPGFLAWIGMLAGMAAARGKAPDLTRTISYGSGGGRRRSKFRCHRGDANGAFGSPGGSQMRAGGYCFHKGVGLRSHYF